ncbi:hypothetical protein ACFL4V_00165 [Candidatus Latescibacterota bacterium]
MIANLNYMWESGDRTIKCPFCGAETIKVFRRPPRLEHNTSSISAGKKTTYYRVPESYEYLSGCSECGKTKNQVKKAYETGVTKEHSHDDRLKRLREAGLPTTIKNYKE